MHHIWMCIEPVQTSSTDWAGVQVMLHGDTASLVRQIDARLQAIGAKIAEHPKVRSVNTEYRIHQTSTDVWREDEVEEQATGLTLKLYPCLETGANIDVDPIEPRGE